MSSFQALEDAVRKAERRVKNTPCACGEFDPDCKEALAVGCVAAHTELKAAIEIRDETFRTLKKDPNAPIPPVETERVIDMTVTARKGR